MPTADRRGGARSTVSPAEHGPSAGSKNFIFRPRSERPPSVAGHVVSVGHGVGPKIKKKIFFFPEADRGPGAPHRRFRFARRTRPVGRDEKYFFAPSRTAARAVSTSVPGHRGYVRSGVFRFEKKKFLGSSNALICGVGVGHVAVSRAIRVRPTSKSSFHDFFFGAK